jgi:parallel beta-helix repeat protein
MVDPGRVTSIITQLLAPDATIGDTDLAVAGVGAEPVGVDLSAETYSSSSMSSSGTRFVDNTPLNGDCPQATYPTIQSAVNASGQGDTIKVCPGTYSEQVYINGHNHDGLKLESLKPLQAIIQWPSTGTSHHLVDVDTADRVSIRGFTIKGPFTSTGCSLDRYEGVLVRNGFDAKIDHNYITMIQDINPALYGCQQGDAVAIGWRNFSVPASASVDHNVIDEYQKNGIQAVNSGTSLQADHNVVTGTTNAAIKVITAGNGIVVFMQAAGVVDHNVVSNNRYTPTPLSTGIILDEAPSGSSQVDHNRVFNNDFGIETDFQNGLEISHNDVYQNLSDAITLCGEPLFGCGFATGIVVRSNKIEDNGGSGLALFGANSNLLKSNHIEGNGAGPGDTTDGLRVDSGSTGNLILSNHMEANTFHDCHDDSSGTGTAGTGNTWQGDQGDTQNPPGICKAN